MRSNTPVVPRRGAGRAMAAAGRAGPETRRGKRCGSARRWAGALRRAAACEGIRTAPPRAFWRPPVVRTWNEGCARPPPWAGRRRARASGRLLPELAGGPQSCGLGTRVVRDLARGRGDGAPEDQLGLRRPAAAADWQVGRTDTAARAVGEEALHAAVLERLEG